ncbi:YpdA family putative bacillithiol disulfide reductase [Pontibacter arcticus]|uniref:YpdA family putative bacillithiol disulfide reductase n=1 Tax=Pontibacter arcticus TaxID=2080288 RepID=A0A364REJ0_9BACT|nr:YpdA family putative bacillithiol disulfide reductase [Pontibacter arcticus]RAU82665.1 YpdA family putative bacillithiol disulfide reductase [Pontibacter arcticus]
MIEPTLDVLIVGGGPIGLACGIEAQKAGLSYLVVEKGCLVNSLFNYPLNMTFFSTADRLEIGGHPFPSIHAKPNRAEALEYYRRVADAKALSINLFEEVESVSESEQFYTITTSKATYRARHIVLATGFYDIPNMLGVPGEELPKVKHYYYDPHFYYKQKVVVIGANNSAADVALETWRKGADVTMVVREPQLGNIKYWTKPDLENRISEGSIKAYFSAHLSEIRELEVDIQSPAGKVTIANDFVMAMTGYKPNFNLLQKVGVTLSADNRMHPTFNPDTMETNKTGVYLAGVVCGGMDTHSWFIENSREHAVKIMHHISTNV